MSPAQVISESITTPNETNKSQTKEIQQCVDKASVVKFIKTLNREAVEKKKQNVDELKNYIEEELIRRFARPKGEDFKNLDKEERDKWNNLEPQFRKEIMKKIVTSNKKEDLQKASEEIEEVALRSVKFRIGDEIYNTFEKWITSNLDRLSTLQPPTLPESIDVEDPEMDKKDTKNMTEEEKKEESKRRAKHPCHHIHLRKSFFKHHAIHKGERKEIFNEEINNLERFFRYVIYQSRQMTNMQGKVTIGAENVQFVLDTLSGICFQKPRDKPVIPNNRKKKSESSSSSDNNDSEPTKVTKRKRNTKSEDNNETPNKKAKKTTTPAVTKKEPKAKKTPPAGKKTGAGKITKNNSK